MRYSSKKLRNRLNQDDLTKAEALRAMGRWARSHGCPEDTLATFRDIMERNDDSVPVPMVGNVGDSVARTQLVNNINITLLNINSILLDYSDYMLNTEYSKVAVAYDLLTEAVREIKG